jgi:hypothetical protein
LKFEEAAMRDKTLIPDELLAITNRLVNASARVNGMKRMPSALTTKANMVPLAMIPDMQKILDFTVLSFRTQLACYFLMLAVLIWGLIINYWIILGLIPLIVLERVMAKNVRSSWRIFSSVLLALEMLSCNFVSWGEAYPASRDKALQILGGERHSWLDYYLPNRESVAPHVLIEELGPK